MTDAPHDPFAVSTYRPEDLPADRDVRLADFGTSEFGPIWIDSLGGPDAAAQFVRRILDPKKSRTAVAHLNLQAGKCPEWIVTPAPKRGDLNERALGLVTIIDLHNGKVPTDIERALLDALGIRQKWMKRQRALSRALRYAELIHSGQNETQAVKAISKGPIQRSVRSIWDDLRLPSMQQIASVRAEHLSLSDDAAGRDEAIRAGIQTGTVSRYPFASDIWFDQGTQNRVAVAIINAIRGQIRKRKQPAAQYRWDTFNLVEGFVRRHLPLSTQARVALDHALNLVDRNGNARRDIPLGGVVSRNDFLDLARARAIGDFQFAPNLVPDHEIETTQAWESSRLFEAAVAHFKRGQ